MDDGERPPIRVSRARFQWLQAQTDRWTAAGLIDAQARERIVALYDAEAAQRQGMLAIVLLAVLMCAVGLLLLIGYNWDLIPRAAKVAILIGAVAAAFAGSAFAYARQRPIAGETLAFAGTLLFGNAILLVAQALHISGHFPDAFLWFTIGTLACAWLVRSQWIGIEAGVFLLLWTFVQGTSTAGPMWAFLLLWPASVAVAYRLGSPFMLLIVALDAGAWAFLSGIDYSRSPAWLASVVLTACALYSIGRWHARASGLRAAWQGGGLLLLLIVLLPLMASGVHRTLVAGESAPICVALAGVAATATMFSLARPARAAVDTTVISVAASVVVWVFLVWSGVFGQPVAMTRIGTVLFSILTLVMAVSLIRAALGSSSVGELSLGVLFAVAFLIIRWTSVIENLLWSGLLLLAAGGGLLLVARLWRKRPRAAMAAGRMS